MLGELQGQARRKFSQAIRDKRELAADTDKALVRIPRRFRQDLRLNDRMASLKDLRIRIRSVRSTQKITSAMKMVAASRLRRAQEQAEAARPYAERMERMLGLARGRICRAWPTRRRLLAGTGKDETHLLVVATSDRGLAGGFNAIDPARGAARASASSRAPARR